MRHAAVEALEPRRFFDIDLTASITAPPTFITSGAGGMIRPTVVIRNDGEDPVRSIWTMRFVISPDAEIGNGNDITLGTETRALVGPGETLTTSPALLLAFPPRRGTHFIGVVLDTTNSVAESNEQNNVAFTATPVVTSFTGSGVLPITGTDGDDVVRVVEQGAVLRITINEHETALVSTGVTGLSISTGAGNDLVELFTDEDATIDTGDGNDVVASGTGDDVIAGGAGRDRLFGGDGNDHIMGGASGDFLFGDGGNDTVSGNGGHDRVTGGSGADYHLGGAGNDFFSAVDGRIDTLSGNAGDDLAVAEALDLLVSVTPALA